MSDALLTAITSVLITALNMLGSVLILWIKAKYRFTPAPGENGAGSHPSPR